MGTAGICTNSSKSRLLLLLLFVLVGTGAAVTLVALVETVAADEVEVGVVEASSAEPPMATGSAAGLLCVKNQPTPIPPPIAIKRRMPTSQTQVDRRVDPLSVFRSHALTNEMFSILGARMLIKLTYLFLDPDLASSLATIEKRLQKSSPLPPTPLGRSVSSEFPRRIPPFSSNLTELDSVRGRTKTGIMGL